MLQKHLKLRNLVQVAFALVTLYIGVKFVLFVESNQGYGAMPQVGRPPGVEAFLPISALVALKSWLTGGAFDKIHPAGLVIFLAIVGVSLLFKKAFCAWICPIGTLSEGLARLGRFFFGRNFKVPKYLDYLLRTLKYLLLLFFINIIFLGMSGIQATAFLRSPYNMISDVKMLQFFQDLSGAALVIVGLLVILSILFENFWCRYLCPYGALLGVVSMISPAKITRSQASCIDCGACTRACPNRIEVAKANRVWSPECNACTNCVNACPAEKTLEFKVNRFTLSPKALAAAVVGVWLLFIITAKLTGHWETSITPEMYKQLIPMADRLGH